jgi:hypothetical protein
LADEEVQAMACRQFVASAVVVGDLAGGGVLERRKPLRLVAEERARDPISNAGGDKSIRNANRMACKLALPAFSPPANATRRRGDDLPGRRQ